MKENSVAWMLQVAIFLMENNTRTLPTALYLQTDVAKHRSSDPGGQKESAQQGDGCRVRNSASLSEHEPLSPCRLQAQKPHCMLRCMLESAFL